mmetsp:Transcript_81582/g.122536  ORF Transcript_81582/g.122536 Transcript_81582/m.122536 type:complete len:90 (-) Transcript_81582:11-280(-)
MPRGQLARQLIALNDTKSSRRHKMRSISLTASNKQFSSANHGGFNKLVQPKWEKAQKHSDLPNQNRSKLCTHRSAEKKSRRMRSKKRTS